MTEVAVSQRTYTRLDRATKLGGLALVAIGLELGGSDPAGIAFGVAGAALALTTVFVTKHE
ncbi:hypothetical protein [Haloarchaeobius sp. HME9146]|uniref:hypothetical protein n=1 Tax=unclassified Haloarchaeobius TaxID=2614452 RepID=UPI0021C22F9C|nr:hypothetical protein [Haloarchaeobius sp. HME9146]MCT9098322.1 hypothetical protein [Haloarchaeobius sp. HME9146]